MHDKLQASGMNRLILLIVLTAGSSLVAPGMAAEVDTINAAAFENGAVLLDYDSEYGDRLSTQWLALMLIDGDAATGWASARGAPFPHTFEIELARPFDLERLVFDLTHSEEASQPGIAAREVVVSVATETRDGPYTEIHRGEIDVSGMTRHILSEPVNARWLKLSIESNGGHAEYTELMEFQAWGRPQIEQRTEKARFSGTYETNWDDFYLIVEDGTINGCYDFDNGRFSGAASGDFMNIEWREDGDQSGTAVLALTADQSIFNGFWYEYGQLSGTWFGHLVEAGREPDCAAALTSRMGEESNLETSLRETGQAVLYGILFDYDTAILKAESLVTLREARDWLGAHPQQRVQFIGHTDAHGSAGYNLDLSGRRASAVRDWMIEQGILPDRMNTEGRGESEPVASNTTAQGRALNRRVEIRIAR